jgi:Lectin C-type domain
MERCCSLGMAPITIDTGKKSACLDKLINGINWKYNSRYWTSGLRSSEKSFQWCSSIGSSVDLKLWLDQEPSNTNGDENCAQLVITKSNSSARLNDNHCGRINAFACQLSLILLPNLHLKCIIRIPILILLLLNRDPQHQNLRVKRPFVQTLHARKMFATHILFMTHSFERFFSNFQNR